MKRTLWIDSRAGISADRMIAALIGLGAPEQDMLRTIKLAAEDTCLLDAHTHIEFLPKEMVAHRLHITPLTPPTLSLEEAPGVLERALSQAGVHGVYADFVRRAFRPLHPLEQHSPDPSPPTSGQTVSLSNIGTAHTPYIHEAPHQPGPEHLDDGTFYIQIAPQYAAGTQALETFTHIFVLSYLDRSVAPEITVRPPWKDDDRRYGTFATRSPNRPSPIGLTRARLLSIEGNRIYTSPLDLFDGTPILDIKPFIRSLDSLTDESDRGNDGWLEGSDHLELHRLGVPHEHPQSTRQTSLPGLEIARLVGIGWGLQHLEVDLDSVRCVPPVNVSQSDTPVGTAILTALAPDFVTSADLPADHTRMGLGLSQLIANADLSFGALRLLLV